jgi:hypothetical protein
MSGSIASAAESGGTSTGNTNESTLSGLAQNEENDMTQMYVFGAQVQEQISMISTLGGLAQDAAKDKPQV